MFYRKMMYIAVLFILLTTTGCSFFRSVDNSSPEDILKYETSKNDLWNQKKALEQEKDVCLRQLADQQAQIVLMNTGMSEQQTKITQVNGQITESNKTIESLNLQIKQFEAEREKAVKAGPVELEKMKGTPTKTFRAPKKDARKKPAAGPAGAEAGAVKIKVLAGEGNIASASAMAKRIKKMGYKVKLVDLAERSNFDVNTVYYVPNQAVTAEEIVKQLGGSAITKPLTWKSVYGLIIVTGKKP